jgi:hypothetical protein
MKRKRAPGGGRKPKGPIKGKSAALSTRITPELRQLLDDAAEEAGRSLSQEVELRLRASFGPAPLRGDEVTDELVRKHVVKAVRELLT